MPDETTLCWYCNHVYLKTDEYCICGAANGNIIPDVAIAQYMELQHVTDDPR